MDRRGALLQVQSAGRHPAAGYRIGIAQAHLKTKAMESMIKRCTELGASHFFFFPAERSVARRRERAGVQGDSVRWRKIAIEACRQSRRYFVPRFEPVRDSEQLAGRFARFDRVFVASLADDSVMIADLLKGDSLRAVRSVLIVVGPEGDFTPGELDLFRSAGALSCRLSEVVLRADTAAIASAAICAAHLAASHAASSGRMT
jgi:16S rRNA (uracil1498-N3)-methyltransferase